MASEKDISKLTSIDEQGSRLFIIPAEVQGYFRRWRTRLHWILIFVFLFLPWVRFGGHQSILLNIPAREFNFFGLLFRAHDAPLIFLVLTVLVMGLAVVTSIWGRIWCGWACPQTVFIDAVFRKIEFWIEGNYIERRRSLNADWSFKKLVKSILKWTLFVLASLVIAHSFLAYFVGTEQLMQMMQRAPSENWLDFTIMLSVACALLFDFTWFREQFCVIMCPYGRIQSVLLDSGSLSIVYDQKRGEPRRGVASPSEKQGDCVSCNRCVEVCPTGIDIRNGLQMECISCTACVDACNEIMMKVKKPAHLISYRTLNNKPLRILKFKTIFYGLIIVCTVGVLAYNLVSRESVDIALLRGSEAPYTISQNELGESVVRNHFRMHLTNQTAETSSYKIELSQQSVQAGFVLTLAQNPITVKSKSAETVHVFVHIASAKLPPSGRLPLSIVLSSQDEKYIRELPFLGPAK